MAERVPMICQLFDTTSTRQYTQLDEQVRHTQDEYDPSPIALPSGMRLPRCYLCCKRINQVHWFYSTICPTCGQAALRKRYLTRDLTGFKALVTGGRLKLGYQIALKLLRAGAQVVITSRNWTNALERYQDEPDYANWSQRLHVCQINFDLLQVDQLLPELEAELNRIWPDDSALDIIIHNAAQTISGVAEAAFSSSTTTDTTPTETTTTETTTTEAGVTDVGTSTAPLSKDIDSVEVPASILGKRKRPHQEKWKKVKRQKVRGPKFPPMHWIQNKMPEVDRYQRKIDHRAVNTWTTRFGQVAPIEAKEVLLANAWAPFVLNQFLMRRLLKSTYGPFIIHVHAKEGHFSSHKTVCHTHTNMAKAAVSMMTRCLAGAETSPSFMSQYQSQWIEGLPWAERFKAQFIHADQKFKVRQHDKQFRQLKVHGVDPGWFSIDEYSFHQRIDQNLLFPPIDEIDAAARVVYPIMVNAPSFPGTWRHYVPLLEF